MRILNFKFKISVVELSLVKLNRCLVITGVTDICAHIVINTPIYAVIALSNNKKCITNASLYNNASIGTNSINLGSAEEVVGDTGDFDGLAWILMISVAILMIWP